MEVLIIRHAIAVDRSEAIEDAARPLTGRGQRRFRRQVEGMRRLGVDLDAVLHSPWLRAAQTAALLEPLCRGPIRSSAHLAASPGELLLAQLREAPDDATVALVGHEPWMGELCALLVTGDAFHGDRFRFKKGGVAWLSGAPRAGQMALGALYTPKSLRLLAA